MNSRIDGFIVPDWHYGVGNHRSYALSAGDGAEQPETALVIDEWRHSLTRANLHYELQRRATQTLWRSRRPVGAVVGD